MGFYQRLKQLNEDKEYAEIVRLMLEYLSDKNNKITPALLDIYAISLINLGDIDEATAIINKINNDWPSFYTGERLYNLAYMYICNFQFDKAEKLIVGNNCFYPPQIFKLAKACYYNFNYDLAKRLFKSLIDFVPKDGKIYTETRKYLEKIRLYETSQEFKPKDCSCFKYKGEVLKPGYIIRSNKLRDNYVENTYNPLPLYLQQNQQYMIWKINYETGKIYAFPIIEAKKRDDVIHTIPAEHYHNFIYDRRLKDDLRVIELTDVTYVMGELTPEDYQKSLDTVYESIYYSNQGEAKVQNLQFMKEILRERNDNVRVGDIIRFYDFNERRPRRFYVFAIEEDGFKTFEITRLHQPETDKFRVTYISKKQFYRNVIRLKDRQVIAKLQAIVPKIEYYNATTRSLHPDISYSTEYRNSLVRRKKLPTISINN